MPTNCLNIVKFMKKRPKIGLTMRLETTTRRFYLGRDYSEALQSFGAIPVHIPLIPDYEFISVLMNDLDGVLLPGSDTDVDPLIYGEEPHHKLGKVIPEKDQTDLLVLAEAEKLGMPVLAICFGMQILNVFRGGTLFQAHALVLVPEDVKLASVRTALEKIAGDLMVDLRLQPKA